MVFLPFSVSHAADGFLRLYHSHTHEFLEVHYEEPSAAPKLARFFRSRDESGLKPANMQLMRLLDQIGDHFRADTIEVICGYRSGAFNAKLKKEGHAVAENSCHIGGLAADIHLDEINEKTLFDYVRSLKKGGAGYYPDVLMVHVDLGPVRTWVDGRFTDRRNIGEFTDVPGRITTDHLFYQAADVQKLTISGKFSDAWELQWFHRGEWTVIDHPPPVRNGKVVWSAATLPFGKFRWKVGTDDGRFQYSNEFYLKKI